MEKQKVNVLIKGDLVCKNELRGGKSTLALPGI